MKSLNELRQFYTIERCKITKRFYNKTRIRYNERINSKRLRIAREEAQKELERSVSFLKLYVDDLYKKMINNRNSTNNFPDGYGV
jgi:hypothetical protein